MAQTKPSLNDTVAMRATEELKKSTAKLYMTNLVSFWKCNKFTSFVGEQSSNTFFTTVPAFTPPERPFAIFHWEVAGLFHPIDVAIITLFFMFKIHIYFAVFITRFAKSIKIRDDLEGSGR